MSNVVAVCNEVLIPELMKILGEGQAVRMTVCGMSMYPFLRDRIDSVELIKADYSEIEKSDIILFKSSDGYVLHRVIRMSGKVFYTVGDVHSVLEGPFDAACYISKVSAIYRRSRRISTKSPLLSLLVVLWTCLLPVREGIISYLRTIKHILKRK